MNKQTCLQKDLIRDLLAFPTRLANEMMDSLGSLPDAQRDAIHATEEEVCQVSNIRVNPSVAIKNPLYPVNSNCHYEFCSLQLKITIYK